METSGMERSALSGALIRLSDLVRRHFSGALKPPFNRDARDRAGFPASYYAPLASG